MTKTTEIFLNHSLYSLYFKMKKRFSTLRFHNPLVLTLMEASLEVVEKRSPRFEKLT